MALSLVLAVSGVAAQTPAYDPSDRLREVLPADVADRVLAKIAEARARGLPAQALEQRALKFASRGVNPAAIEQSVSDHSQRMEHARSVIERARGAAAVDDEVDAGAEALRMGVDGAAVSELARSAPSGRSLAVPLLVIGSLVDRGLPSDDALQRVLDRLQARVTDAELEGMPGAVPAGKPAVTGQDLAGQKRPEAAGPGRAAGPPTSVPGNAGAGARPTAGQMPTGTKRPPTPPIIPPALP
ncbi:MAG TPA: hypothetical protein VLE53_03030 [Gemmatimonadaceae bacterium]|nr:hypothetical protein [Gemmatimonadaceae bacterium]